jgi:magnesium and cobalt transporter
MGETSDGQAGTAAAPPGADPDSPAKSFFSRIFRRESAEDDDESSRTSALASRANGSAGRGMVPSLRNLRRLRVDDVSVPRADIVAVSDTATLEEVLAVFKESTFSRLPVYSETLDQPLGLVHLKDLALKYGFGAPTEAFDLRALVRPLLYAPPSMPIWVLLQKMQAARIHMALVIDEYGGVDGLVTIENVLEQVVGDIADEHDEDESQLWTEEAPATYLAQARLDLEAFEAAAGVRLAPPELAEEVDTLGGLVIRLAGRVPARGEVVPHPDGHEFEVVDADARRIKRVRVRLASGARASAEAAE